MDTLISIISTSSPSDLEIVIDVEDTRDNGETFSAQSFLYLYDLSAPVSFFFDHLLISSFFFFFFFFFFIIIIIIIILIPPPPPNKNFDFKFFYQGYEDVSFAENVLRVDTISANEISLIVDYELPKTSFSIDPASLMYLDNICSGTIFLSFSLSLSFHQPSLSPIYSI